MHMTYQGMKKAQKLSVYQQKFNNLLENLIALMEDCFIEDNGVKLHEKNFKDLLF